MATSEILTQKAIDRIVKDKEPCERRDARGPGLVFRMRDSGHYSWSIRRTVRNVARRVSLGPHWSLDDARTIAVELDRRIRERRDPWINIFAEREWNQWIADKTCELTGRFVPVKEFEKPKLRSIPWRLAVKEFLVERELEQRSKTADTNRKELSVSEFKPFETMDVASISAQQINTALYGIRSRGKMRQMETSGNAIRMLFKFLGRDDQRDRTGVAKEFWDTIEVPKRVRVKDDKTGKRVTPGKKKVRIPKAPDVAAILKHVLSDDCEMLLRDRLAVALTVYSVQRRYTVAQARQEEFEPAHVGGLWMIPALHIKTATDREERGLDPGVHVVPLPDMAWRIVLRAKEAAGGSPWLFPATKDRREGQEAFHVSESTVTHKLREASGGQFSPHDIRKAFGTPFAEQARYTENHVKKILDHSEGVDMTDVTKKHYSFLSGTHEKWEIMEDWVKWINGGAS